MMRNIFYALSVVFIVSSLVWAATTYTTNYSLAKPGVGDTGWGSAVNSNFDTIDTQLKTNANAVATAANAANAFGTDNVIIRSDGVGRGVQETGIVISDANNVSGVGTLNTHTIPGGTGTFALTSGNVATATALAANGANCSAGSAPLGVDASGASESCTDYEEDLSNSAGLASAISDETGTGSVVFSNSPTLVTPALGTIASGVGTALTALDGENIQDDTIDDDSIDFVDVTGADLTLTDATAVTTSGKIISNGNLDVKNGTTSSGVLAIFEDSDNGTNKATFQVPALTADTVYILPANDGNASEVLTTDGSGTLTWEAVAGSGDITAVGDCVSGACFTGTSGTTLSSNTDIIIGLDDDNNGTESFQIIDGADALVAEIAESGLITTLVGIDAIGAVDMDYGSADVTDHTFITDGTGDAEIVLPDDSIGDAEIAFDEVTGADLTLTDATIITASGLITANANLNIGNGATSAGTLKLLEDTDNGSNYTTFKVGSQAGNIDYVLPTADASGVLTSDGSGNLSWVAAGAGDVTAVGDCATGACFGGASGTTLTSTTSEVLNLGTANTLIFQRNDAGSVTFTGADDAGAADTIYDTTGAGAITVGSADVTSVTVTTDGTGSAEVVLPTGAIESGEILDNTITGSDTADDTFDFVDFEDTLDLDANLTLNQTTSTWSQTFTGDTTVGLTYTANSLTSGSAVSVASTATGLTGDLTKVELTGAGTGNTGNVMKVGITGTGVTGTALNVTNAGTGFTARFNDDGTYTDTTSFVIDGSGNVGIGDTSPAALLTVGASDKFQVDSNGNVVKIDNVTYDWPNSNSSGVLTNNGSGTLTWAAASGGGSTTIPLYPYSAKISGAYVTATITNLDVATQGCQIDAGDGNWRVLCDASTDEAVVFYTILPSNYVSTPVCKIQYSMASATSSTVEFECAVQCVTPGDSADIGTASFASGSTATETVPGTAGYVSMLSITPTDDSCAAGDIIYVYISTDANDGTNDAATGDRELVGAYLSFT